MEIFRPSLNARLCWCGRCWRWCYGFKYCIPLDLAGSFPKRLAFTCCLNDVQKSRAQICPVVAVIERDSTYSRASTPLSVGSIRSVQSHYSHVNICALSIESSLGCLRCCFVVRKSKRYTSPPFPSFADSNFLLLETYKCPCTVSILLRIFRRCHKNFVGVTVHFLLIHDSDTIVTLFCTLYSISPSTNKTQSMYSLSKVDSI